MKQLTPREFQALGVLQEVNRLVLHPVGLALGVSLIEGDAEDPGEFFIWDARDDPEGIYFASGVDRNKVTAHKTMVIMRQEARMRKLGYIVQEF